MKGRTARVVVLCLACVFLLQVLHGAGRYVLLLRQQKRDHGPMVRSREVYGLAKGASCATVGAKMAELGFHPELECGREEGTGRIASIYRRTSRLLLESNSELVSFYFDEHGLKQVVWSSWGGAWLNDFRTIDLE